MSDKKYEFTEEFVEVLGGKLYRIKALRSFRDVEAGEVGGFVAKKENLSQEGDCWVYDNAKVCGDAKVWGDAEVWGDAKVYGNAEVCGDAEVYGNAKVCGGAEVQSNDDIVWVASIGSRAGTTTFFKALEGTLVNCGCFNGTLEEFQKAVERTHGSNNHGQRYMAAINLAKLI